MLFRKSVSTALIVSQLCFGLNLAFADSTTATTSTTASPEATLIQTATAIQGSGLSQTEMQKQLTTAITTYTTTAPTDNRQERLQQAMVDMNIMTTQQASVLTQQVSTDMSTGKVDATTELQNLLKAPAMGAQFSFCEGTAVTFMGLWAGALTLALAGHFDGGNQGMYQAAVVLIVVGMGVGLVGYGGGC